jgi:hypothetical protein
MRANLPPSSQSAVPAKCKWLTREKIQGAQARDGAKTVFAPSASGLCIPEDFKEERILGSSGLREEAQSLSLGADDLRTPCLQEVTGLRQEAWPYFSSVTNPAIRSLLV